jgi:ATP-dependent helicase YprA (DUF1998 family)
MRDAMTTDSADQAGLYFGARDGTVYASLDDGESWNQIAAHLPDVLSGIDVGDLDQVIQIGAPSTVASLLQRLGRTGRRPGTSRSLLFLATSDEELIRAAALLLLWSEGYVEPVQPPPQPRQVLAQQLLALALQKGRVGFRTWAEPLAALAMASTDETTEIAAWMLRRGHLDEDSGMLFVGPEAERSMATGTSWRCCRCSRRRRSSRSSMGAARSVTSTRTC